MRFGLIESPQLRLFDGDFSHYVALKSSVTVATSFTLILPNALPGSTQALTVDSSGNLGYASLGAGGTVTSVGLAAPNIFSVAGSPVTTSGTLTLSLANQAPNQFFAGPASGGAAVPSFRSLDWNDLSTFAGATASSFARGNDARLHTQNTDTGTTQTTFQVDSGNAGPRLKNNGGVLEVRNATDTGYSDIIVGNVTIKGNTTTIESETLAIGDSTIVLNQEYAGSTPTENGGILVERGTLTNAALLWDESSDRWMAGLAGSEVPIARKYSTTFTSTNLVAGVLTVTHNLGQQNCHVEILDGSNKRVMPDEVTFGGANSLTVELSAASFGAIAGTWKVVVTG